jgi:hypothetical protein
MTHCTSNDRLSGGVVSEVVVPFLVIGVAAKALMTAGLLVSAYVMFPEHCAGFGFDGPPHPTRVSQTDNVGAVGGSGLIEKKP